MELKHCIGDYEFCVAPKSLFSEDEIPLACKDKSTNMKITKNLENSKVQIPGNTPCNFALITHGMAVVNGVLEGKSMKACEVSACSSISKHEKSNILHSFFVLIIIASLTPNSRYRF